MASMNKVILVGNLTSDPESKTFDTGSTVTNLRMAVNSRYRTKDGKDKTEVCFVDMEVWGNQARACFDYLHQGSQLLVEGRLLYDEWEDKESGKRRSRIRIRADRVQFLDGKRKRDPDTGESGGEASGRVEGVDGGSGAAPNDDDLPYLPDAK